MLRIHFNTTILYETLTAQEKTHTIFFSKLFGFFICNIPLCFQICFISYEDYHLVQEREN